MSACGIQQAYALSEERTLSNPFLYRRFMFSFAQATEQGNHRENLLDPKKYYRTKRFIFSGARETVAECVQIGLPALANLGRPRPLRSSRRRGNVLWRRGRHCNICWAWGLYLRPDRDTRCPEILSTPVAGRCDKYHVANILFLSRGKRDYSSFAVP